MNRVPLDAKRYGAVLIGILLVMSAVPPLAAQSVFKGSYVFQGTVNVGTFRDDTIGVYLNSESTARTIAAVTIDDVCSPSQFTVLSPSLPAVVQPGQRFTLVLRYQPRYFYPAAAVVRFDPTDSLGQRDRYTYTVSANTNLGLTPCGAHGFVRDATGNPLSGVDVSCYAADSTGTLILLNSVKRSDANGFWSTNELYKNWQYYFRIASDSLPNNGDATVNRNDLYAEQWYPQAATRTAAQRIRIMADTVGGVDFRLDPLNRFSLIRGSVTGRPAQTAPYHARITAEPTNGGPVVSTELSNPFIVPSNGVFELAVPMHDSCIVICDAYIKKALPPNYSGIARRMTMYYPGRLQRSAAGVLYPEAAGVDGVNFDVANSFDWGFVLLRITNLPPIEPGYSAELTATAVSVTDPATNYISHYTSYYNSQDTLPSLVGFAFIGHEDYTIDLRVVYTRDADSSQTLYLASYQGANGPLLRVRPRCDTAVTVDLVKQFAGGRPASLRGTVSGMAGFAATSAREADLFILDAGKYEIVSRMQTSGGAFSTTLPEGSYLLFARGGAGALPQFSGGTLDAFNADFITLVAGSEAEGHVALQPLGAASEGTTELQGTIRTLGQALGFALVTVQDSSGAIVNFGFTDSHGEYRIENLPAGVARANAICAGFETQTKTLEVPLTDRHIHADFELGRKILSVPATESVRRDFRLLGNHPNPFRDQTTLLLDAAYPAAYELNLTDLLGRKVLAQRGRVNSGRQEVLISAGNLAPGMYLCTYTAGGSVHSIPILVAR